ARLEEGIAAVLEVGDARVAALPLDGVVRIDARAREVPADPDSELLRRHRHSCVSPFEPGRARLSFDGETTTSCGCFPSRPRDGGALHHCSFSVVNDFARLR